jgi:hypothetical protein
MKILLLGGTGTAGTGALQACISDPRVVRVNALTRGSLAVSHPKVRGFQHDDYANFAGAETAFSDIDACLYCLGVSATRVSAEDYRQISYDMPLAAARMLRAQSPTASFHYISGAGTAADSRMRWARVKAETEAALVMQFAAVCWRPALIEALPITVAARGRPWWLGLVLPVLRRFPQAYVHSVDLGYAMLQAVREGVRGRVLENSEIHAFARQFMANQSFLDTEVS